MMHVPAIETGLHRLAGISPEPRRGHTVNIDDARFFKLVAVAADALIFANAL